MECSILVMLHSFFCVAQVVFLYKSFVEWAFLCNFAPRVLNIFKCYGKVSRPQGRPDLQESFKVTCSAFVSSR